jgi:hypothetical protein
MLLFVDFEATKNARLSGNGYEGSTYCYIYEIFGGKVVCENHRLGRFAGSTVKATVEQVKGKMQIVISTIVDGANSESSLSAQLGE